MAGISLFSENATDMQFGSAPITAIYFGNVQVWPAGGGTTYIVLPNTGGTISSSANYAYISNISASTTSWTVESDSTSWLTVSKTSNTQVRYNVSENGADERTGHLYFKIGDTRYASYTVKQMGSTLYIVLTPTSVSPWNGWAKTDTISVSSNTNNWTVQASSSPASGTPYFRASKTNNTTITWTMDENFGTSSRIGYVDVSYGSTTAQTVVYQNAGYYIYIEGGSSPRSVSSGGGNVSISVISNYGNTPVPVDSASSQSWLTCTAMTNAGGGRYVYTFKAEANPSINNRSAILTFTQQMGNDHKSISINITQWAKYVPASISGFTVFTTYGDWQLGKFFNGSYAGPNASEKVYTAAIIRSSQPTASCVANFDMTYYTRVTSSTTYTSTSGPRPITTASTVNIPSGATAYGITIAGGPNLTITGVQNFSVG